MRFVNKDSAYLKMCELQGVSAHEPAERAPDLLEVTAGSDVSIVVKHEIFLILGKSNRQPLISLIYYFFQSKYFWQNLIMFM